MSDDPQQVEPVSEPENASQDAPAGAEASSPPGSAPEKSPVTVIRAERHYGATDVFGYHLEIPGGYIEVEYLSDGSVRSADGAHPLHPSVFVRPAHTEAE